MQNEFGYRTRMKVDRKVGRTYLGLEIFAPGIFGEVKKFDWPKYFEACRQNLYRIAAEQSFEILCWSVEPNEERESICHAIAVRGALEGCLPVRLTRALRPPKGYSVIDFLARSLQKGWQIEQILKGQVQAQRLQRYDRRGKSLREPIPSQLLARAILESDWRMLIRPCDNPWAFINAVTRRIYERDYQDAEGIEADLQEFELALRYEQIVGGGQSSSDDLALDNVLKVLRAAGCPEDSIEVLQATRIQGKKLRELPEYLSSKTGSPWDARRVEAARGRLRRREHKLHAVALASSQWKRPQTRTAVYRERLPDGASWNGLWTYAHSYHGEELELLYEIMARERSRLVRRK